MRIHPLITVVFGFLLALNVSGQETNDILVKALQDELARSLSELQLEDEPKPYFISYLVSESRSTIVTSVLGSITTENILTQRLLSVMIRVGDPTLDNSNFGLPGIFVLTENLPVTDSYDELRRVVWHTTDSAYKQAISTLAAKITALESMTEEERLDDFSAEDPFTHIDPELDRVEAVDMDAFRALINDLSTVALGNTAIQSSSTTGSFFQTTRTYLDSETNFHRVAHSTCAIQSNASTQIANGLEFKDVNSIFSETCDQLPDVEELRQSQLAFLARLGNLKEVEKLSAYAGPVLFEDQAAADFLVQMLLSRLAARPKPVVDSQMFGMPQFPENPFQGKIGRRVLPKFLSVTNDPLTSTYNGTSLLGSYAVDAEGVPARETVLIEEGELKTLLTTRAPVTGITKSTGSNRLQSGALPGNLIVSATETSTREELIEMLLELADDSGEEFGIVVRRIQNPDEMSPEVHTMMSMMQSVISGALHVFPVIEAVKVYADGREVPILPVTFSNVNDSVLRDIVAVSEDVNVFNIPVTLQSTIALFSLSNPFAAGSFSPAMVGVVTPSLLIEEVELADAGGEKPKLPIVPHPLLDASIN